VNSGYFHFATLVFILASTLLLAFDNPHTQRSEAWDQAVNALNIVFLVAFSLEMLMKMTVVGVLTCPGRPYLKNAWNFVDFLVVVVALVSLVNSLLLGIYSLLLGVNSLLLFVYSLLLGVYSLLLGVNSLLLFVYSLLLGVNSLLLGGAGRALPAGAPRGATLAHHQPPVAPSPRRVLAGQSH
jgi:hypothetical protein